MDDGRRNFILFVSWFEGFRFRVCLESESVACDSSTRVATLDNRFEAFGADEEKWDERGRAREEDLIDFRGACRFRDPKDGIESGNFERADATCRHGSSSCAVKFPGQP